jgi:hypothetical protein
MKLASRACDPSADDRERLEREHKLTIAGYGARDGPGNDSNPIIIRIQCKVPRGRKRQRNDDKVEYWVPGHSNPVLVDEAEQQDKPASVADMLEELD